MNLFKISVFVFFYSLITNTYAVKIETDLEKLSYSMGIYFGQTVNSQEMEIDIPAFMQAVEDVLSNAEKKMTDGEMKKILSTYKKMEQDQRAAESDSNKIKGEKYLAENKDKEGVITLPSVPAEVSPEGAHQDGYDCIAMFGIARHNILGGELLVSDGEMGNPFVSIPINEGTGVFLNDQALWHNASSLAPIEKGRTGYMDAFILTANK